MKDQVKRYEEVRKITIGRGDDYTTGCLLDYQYFKDHYQLIAVGLSKQKKIICWSKSYWVLWKVRH